MRPTGQRLHRLMSLFACVETNTGFVALKTAALTIHLPFALTLIARGLLRGMAVPTQSLFFTVRLADQSSDLLVRHIDLLRDAVTLTRHKWPFVIESAVVLPNRLHMIWTLSDHDADYGKRWKMIKTTFNRHLPKKVTQKARAEGRWIWQRRYWEQTIETPEELATYLHLIWHASSAPKTTALVP